MMENKDLQTLITPEDLARRWTVSRAFIYKQVREKKIPYYHLGKNIRFDLSEVTEWLKTTANGEYHRDRDKRIADRK
jgi:excisionase family DNA binding protein